MALQKLKISRLYKDIDLSFTANALSGDIGKKIDVNGVCNDELEFLAIT